MTCAATLPQLIQGGMGVGISGWSLARAVSSRGQLGVVSGTGLDTLFVRRLQNGDVGGHLRRAIASFPNATVAARVLERFFRPEGRAVGRPYRATSKFHARVSRFREQITVLANFVEVHLAKEGHSNPVGINLLRKIQPPTLASLYGAMLASVDVVLMGAGIPREIPHALDELAAGRRTALRLDVEGGVEDRIELDPRTVLDEEPRTLLRPAFLPIVSSASLATLLAKKSSGTIDGLVVEGWNAGGHNAPPRGVEQRGASGEPVYGTRDAVDFGKIRDIGLPFWIAGGQGSPEKLLASSRLGASGVQVGSLFALCRESGLAPELRRRALTASANGPLDVFTDPEASPTGFPFKVVALPGTLSEPSRYAARTRVCDLGYLATPFRRPDGVLDFRCPAEPVERFVAKGGDAESTRGRVCLCNALLATAGHPQLRPGGDLEPPIVTSGTDLATLRILSPHGEDYAASDVIDYLLSGVPGPSTPGGELPTDLAREPH